MRPISSSATVRTEIYTVGIVCKYLSLFVFSINGHKQNAGSLLTHVSFTVFYALSYGTLGFSLHGSFFDHSLIGGNSLTANQIL